MDYKEFIEAWRNDNRSYLDNHSFRVYKMLVDCRNELCSKCGEYKWDYLDECQCRKCGWRDL